MVINVLFKKFVSEHKFLIAPWNFLTTLSEFSLRVLRNKMNTFIYAVGFSTYRPISSDIDSHY